MNLLHFGLVVLGALALLTYKYGKAPKTDFSWNIFLQRNVPVLILNVIVGVAAILSGWIDSVQINGTEVGAMWWFGIGLGGQFIFRKFYKVLA
jgi:hypothetical protein